MRIRFLSASRWKFAEIGVGERKRSYSGSALSYLKRARLGSIVPAILWGRKNKEKHALPTGMRALLKKNNGFYRQTITGKGGTRTKARLTITVCVAGKDPVKETTGQKGRKKLLYAIPKVRLTWEAIRELDRKRFNIETTYRQMNEARIKTCTREPRLRLLFAGVALLLRNVWGWIHFRLAKHTFRDEPELFPELLRFEEMLLWITQVVQHTLGADKTLGIDRETYQRLADKCQQGSNFQLLDFDTQAPPWEPGQIQSSDVSPIE